MGKDQEAMPQCGHCEERVCLPFVEVPPTQTPAESKCRCIRDLSSRQEAGITDSLERRMLRKCRSELN